MLASLAVCVTAACAPTTKMEQVPQSLFLYEAYDETRDVVTDIEQAIAQANGRHILMEVGGSWCPFCRQLEEYIQSEPQVHDALAQSFILVKVDEKRNPDNKAFLRANFPKPAGYPHFFVLDSDGNFLHSQIPTELKRDRVFQRDKFLQFAERWGPSNP